MEMSGEYRIKAPRAEVWAALNDPAVLKASIPGCKELTKTSDHEMTATVEAKVGMVKAKFNGAVTLSNINPPASYTISGEGKGGVAGFAKGGADVKLTEIGSETVLRYTAKGQVGGKLAQVGARLIDATAKQMADQFFSAFASQLNARQPAMAGAASTAAPAMAAPPPRPPMPAPGSEEGAVARAEHAVENAAHSIAEVAHEAEEEAEEAAVRGFLGGPQMWGLIALAIVIIGILIFFR